MTAHTHPRLHPDWLPPVAAPSPRKGSGQAADPTPSPAHACWHAAQPSAAAIAHPHRVALAPQPDPAHPHRVVVLPSPQTPADPDEQFVGLSTSASASPLRTVAAHGCAPAAPDALSATASASPLRAGEGPGERSAEDAELRAAPPPASDGRMTQLDHSALPLRHRIYALYCEGRTFTAIARTLWLDRGTVARHVHAIEATLLAEQTETSLAVLRLRAIEAQHAILAAAWDALKFEEHQEYDYERERDRDRVEDHHYTPQPARSRRAQLLATAARAARTAAQLQGLFTPAALTAALRDALRDALPAASAIAPAASAPSTGLPIACNATDRPLTTPPAHPANAALVAPAASCGMPAPAPAPSMASAAPATRESPLGFPGAFISTDRPPTAPPTLADYPANSIRDVPLTTPPARRDDPVPVTPAAFCGMPASAIAPTTSASPLRAGDGPEERSVRRATGLPRAYLM